MSWTPVNIADMNMFSLVLTRDICNILNTYICFYFRLMYVTSHSQGLSKCTRPFRDSENLHLDKKINLFALIATEL